MSAKSEEELQQERRERGTVYQAIKHLWLPEEHGASARKSA
jgi:hypothetical protein